jgi:site-specific DNA recombinase
LVYKCDRLFRSMLAFSKFYDLLKTYDVELVSVSEGLSSKNQTASLVFNLMMSVAQYEKSTIVNRLSSGRHYKVKQGIRGYGGVVPFGYKRTNKGDVVVDSQNSKSVQYIYKKVNQLKDSKMSKTKKTQHILRLLKQKGYTFNGKDFDCYKLRRVLSNPFYMGVINYGSSSSMGTHQPLVSKRLYNLVQSV